MTPSELPPLDAHAHIAADVTAAQLAGLDRAVVFAVTRSAKEALYALRPGAASTAGLVWGLGSHPGDERTVASFDESLFEQTLASFSLVGEVGLDRRGSKSAQGDMFRSVLRAASDQPVLLSVHSAGRCTAVLDELERQPLPGVILHWFNGTPVEMKRAIDLDCYFSVNTAMSRTTLKSLPLDRVLTETDFPAARTKTGAARPGDVASIETLLGELHGGDVRQRVWMNLASICRRSGASQRMPAEIQAILESMPGSAA